LSQLLSHDHGRKNDDREIEGPADLFRELKDAQIRNDKHLPGYSWSKDLCDHASEMFC